MDAITRAGLAALAAIALVPPAAAQDAGTITAEDAMAQARDTYGLGGDRQGCGDDDSGEIVVCGGRAIDQRVPSSANSDPASRAARHALDNGVPRAPQLDRGSCKGQAGCIVGGWAPPPVYMIDLKTIPEAPAGSDADRVGKGELADR